MQALNSLGRKNSEQSARAAEVWRNIIGTCALGDTLILDFVINTNQTEASGIKLASFTGSVSAVVDKSKKTPKVMFRAEGFREQIQLPPTSMGGSAGAFVAPGTDAASLVEFLNNSKLVGAAVMRRDRDSNDLKAVLTLGTRAKTPSQVTKHKPNAVGEMPAPKEPTRKEELVSPKRTEDELVKDPLKVVEEKCTNSVPEPMEAPQPENKAIDPPELCDPETPFFLLSTEQKSSYVGNFFDRLYVDEPTAVHLGATLLLSMLRRDRSATCPNGAQNKREDAPIPVADSLNASRFQSFYTRGAVSSSHQAQSPGDANIDKFCNVPEVAPHEYEDDDEDEVVEQTTSPVHSGVSSQSSKPSKWEAVGSGAFASVYKVSSRKSHVAIKLVRGLLHSSEEGSDETQVSLFQKITAELRSQLVPEHMETCPSVARALSLPTRAATGLAAPTLRGLKKSVGILSSKESRMEEPLTLSEDTPNLIFHEQLTPSHLREAQWYERPLAILSAGHVRRRLEVMDVIHMQGEAEACGTSSGSEERSGPRSAPPGRVSFFPFSREIELLLEWKELMENELKNNHPNPSATAGRQNLEDDGGLRKKIKRAHEQHCYSLLLRPAISEESRPRSILSTSSKKTTASLQTTLSVAEIFASRRVLEPAAACGITIQRPTPSPCRLGFTSGAIGVRQSSVGELMNLQLCTGKDHVVSLYDWGYRGSRLGEFVELSIAFLTEMAGHTHVGKSELLNLSSLSSVASILGEATSKLGAPCTKPKTQGVYAMRQFEISRKTAAKHIPFSLSDPLFPSLDHLLACSQSQLAHFGLPSLLEGTAGIVMPFCDQPLNKLQRKVCSMVLERRNLAEVVNSEFQERLAVLRRMDAYLATTKGSSSETGLSYLPRNDQQSMLLEPTFDNPFGFALHDAETRYWINKLPELEELQTWISSLSKAPRPQSNPLLLHGPAATEPESLEKGAARLMLPNRFSDRAERLSLTIGVLRDLIPALESLHSTDVVHRDVKPNNIMVLRERCYEAPRSDTVEVQTVDGIQPVPRLLFEFLGSPGSLLERNRCSFELIDLGWGRILPPATVGVVPLPSGPKDETAEADPEANLQLDVSESESDEDEKDQPRRRGMMASPGERRFDENRRKKSLYVGPETNNKNNELPLMPVLNSQQAAPAYSNPFGQLAPLPIAGRWDQAHPGQKRDRDVVPGLVQGPPLQSSLSNTGVPFQLPFTQLPTAQTGGLPQLQPFPALPMLPAGLPIQKLDPKLFSMQRKVAAFQGLSGGLPALPTLPTRPLPGLPSLGGISFTDLEKAPFPLAATQLPTVGRVLPRTDFSAVFKDQGSNDQLPASEDEEEEEGGYANDDDAKDFLLSGPAGNMCYRAPEFLLGPREPLLIPGANGPDGSRYAYSPSIDVFALGTVLFELLTGTRFLKARPHELAHQELRNGHLLQRMVESLGFPKVWVAEVVVKLRGVKPSGYPKIIQQSPFAIARIKSASALRVAQKCLEQLEAFLMVESVRRNRVLDATSLEAAIAFAWEEVVAGTTGAAKMHSISDTSGSTGNEVYCEADNDVTGTKESIMRSSLLNTAGKIRPYCIIPVRLLGQHGYGRVLYQHQEALEKHDPLQPPPKRPQTSIFVLKCLQQRLKPAWAYEPRSASKMGFKGLLEVDDERKAFAAKAGSSSEQLRGTFSGSVIPDRASASKALVSDADRILEVVGLVSRMLSWEPSERPSLSEVLSSGCFQLLCGDDRGFYDL